MNIEKNMNITIKQMETDDEVRGKAFVHWKSWQETYPGLVDRKYLEENMTLEKCLDIAFKWRDNIIVAKDGNRVVGFVRYGGYRGEDLTDTGEVQAIYLLSEYHGLGVGYALMNEAVRRLSGFKRIALWVLKGNERAIRFYRRYGFCFDGKESEFRLGDGMNTELRMVLERD